LTGAGAAAVSSEGVDDASRDGIGPGSLLGAFVSFGADFEGFLPKLRIAGSTKACDWVACGSAGAGICLSGAAAGIESGIEGSPTSLISAICEPSTLRLLRRCPVARRTTIWSFRVSSSDFCRNRDWGVQSISGSVHPGYLRSEIHDWSRERLNSPFCKRSVELCSCTSATRPCKTVFAGVLSVTTIVKPTKPAAMADGLGPILPLS